MLIRGLENYSKSDIRIMIVDYIDDLLLGVTEEEFKYIDMKLVGSRINENNREDSDLDVVLHYSGKMKEDGLFNLLNDYSNSLYIDNVVVDINQKNINNNNILI